MDIVGQLQEGMTRFSAQESRVAAFILQNLSFTASASIDELAVRAGVSAATITRFARSVGCEDIRDLRKQLAQACERRTSWLNEESAALPAAWRDKLSLISANLEQQLVSTPESTLQKLRTRLQNARAVHCFALGAQDIALATLLQHQLLSIGIVMNLQYPQRRSSPAGAGNRRGRRDFAGRDPAGPGTGSDNFRPHPRQPRIEQYGLRAAAPA